MHACDARVGCTCDACVGCTCRMYLRCMHAWDVLAIHMQDLPSTHACVLIDAYAYNNRYQELKRMLKHDVTSDSKMDDLVTMTVSLHTYIRTYMQQNAHISDRNIHKLFTSGSKA